MKKYILFFILCIATLPLHAIEGIHNSKYDEQPLTETEYNNVFSTIYMATYVLSNPELEQDSTLSDRLKIMEAIFDIYKKNGRYKSIHSMLLHLEKKSYACIRKPTLENLDHFNISFLALGLNFVQYSTFSTMQYNKDGEEVASKKENIMRLSIFKNSNSISKKTFILALTGIVVVSVGALIVSYGSLDTLFFRIFNKGMDRDSDF